jgi:hypothetical protein
MRLEKKWRGVESSDFVRVRLSEREESWLRGPVAAMATGRDK